MGTLAKIKVDGEEAALETPIKNDSYIQIIAGEDGQTPKIYLFDVIGEVSNFELNINDKSESIKPRILVNGEATGDNRLLADGDVVEVRQPRTVGEALRLAGYSPTGRKIKYTLNGRQSSYTCSPTILMNDSPVQISLPIHQGDSIEYIANDMPKISDVIKVSNLEASVKIFYENEEYEIPAATFDLKLNGRAANRNSIIDEDATIEYKSLARVVTVSDALLAIDFKPPDSKSRMKFKILINGKAVDFADPITNGDKLEIELTPPEEDSDLPKVPPEFANDNKFNSEAISNSDSTDNQSAKARAIRTPLKELRERKKLTISDFIRPD